MKNKTAEPVGVGIIGCGLMGSVHAQAYAATRGCRLLGYVNRTADKAQTLAKQYGGQVYTNLSDMLKDPQIQAVSICTDQTVHAEQALAAIQAGKHVLCEKPLALTVRELDQLQHQVARSKVTFMVAHQMRFHPVIEQVRRYMPKLGRCFHLSMEWCFRIKGHEGRCWAGLRTGGFFMELGVHAMDLARHLMGEVAHVQASTLRIDPKRKTEDLTHCLLQFESSAIASVLVTANHRATRQGLLIGRVLGERGRIEFTVYPYQRVLNQATLILDGGKSVFIPDLKRQPIVIPKRPSRSKVFRGFYDVYEREVAAFVKAIRTHTAPAVTLADGRAAVELVLASYDAQGRLADSKPFTKRGSASYRLETSSHPLMGSKS